MPIKMAKVSLTIEERAWVSTVLPERMKSRKARFNDTAHRYYSLDNAIGWPRGQTKELPNAHAAEKIERLEIYREISQMSIQRKPKGRYLQQRKRKPKGRYLQQRKR